jgi:hypothetical protein
LIRQSIRLNSTFFGRQLFPPSRILEGLSTCGLEFLTHNKEDLL